MSVRDYSDYVRRGWSRRRLADPHTGISYEELRNLYIMTTGLAGETGEVTEHLKKYVRDGKLDLNKLLLELGDALHYLTKIGQHFGFPLVMIQEANMRKLDSRQEYGKDEIIELDIAETVRNTADFQFKPEPYVGEPSELHSDWRAPR